MKNDNTVLLVIIALLAIALLVVGCIAITAEPEVVTETIEVPADCPVAEEVVCDVCDVCAEPVVCPIYSDEFIVDYEQDSEVRVLFDSAITEEEFSEDLLDFINTEFSVDIEDVDDMTIEYNKNYEVEWNDREDGEAEVSATLKVYYEISGEDEEFERVDVTFELDDEDLEEFDSYEFTDY